MTSTEFLAYLGGVSDANEGGRPNKEQWEQIMLRANQASAKVGNDQPLDLSHGRPISARPWWDTSVVQWTYNPKGRFFTNSFGGRVQANELSDYSQIAYHVGYEDAAALDSKKKSLPKTSSVKASDPADTVAPTE